MSKKYIITIKSEYEDSFKGVMILGAKDSNLFVDTLAVEDLEELNSDYINEHFSDLQDDAYNKGYAQCQDDYSDALKHAKDTAYQKGLEDGKAQREHDDKIEVGDEVIYNGTTKCIVVRPEDDERYASLIDSDGTHYSADHRECKKTGRHFDIASILEAMKA